MFGRGLFHRNARLSSLNECAERPLIVHAYVGKLGSTSEVIWADGLALLHDTIWKTGSRTC